MSAAVGHLRNMTLMGSLIQYTNQKKEKEKEKETFRLWRTTNFGEDQHEHPCSVPPFMPRLDLKEP